MCIPRALTLQFLILPTEHLHRFRAMFVVNNNYFPIQIAVFAKQMQDVFNLELKM
jgi:hypothetical protein